MDWYQEIYVMDSDGTNLRRIAETHIIVNCGSNMEPNWSPDGSQIIYALDGEIFKMNADGTQGTQVTHNRSCDAVPAFSPGGGKIVFASNRDGDYDLYIMNADGTDSPHQLTNQPGDDYAPDWQPIQ